MIGRFAQTLRRLLRRRSVRIYLILLVLSHFVTLVFNPDVYRGFSLPRHTEEIELALPQMGDNGPIGKRTVRITGVRWPAVGESEGREPILLLHGSPSLGAMDFQQLGPELALTGRDVYAFDRPGYGKAQAWVADYSMISNAHLTLAIMDELGIERAHLGAWSWSGGPILHMADMAPERVASLTMIGAVGIQEGEGSGSYVFEHVKYAIGYAGLVVLPELIPHFNLLAATSFRHAFIRDFWDSDQRPLRGIMERIDTPMLILHGRHDFLIYDWVAREHHTIAHNSRLVILDGGHFLVYDDEDSDTFEIVRASMTHFLARHDTPGHPVLNGSAILAPPHDKSASSIGGFDISRTTPWWVLILLIALATFISEDLTVIAVGLLVASSQLDLGVGLVGCFLGIIAGDVGLWAIGRYLGRRLLRRRFFRRIISEASLNRWGRVFEHHTGKAVFLSRCLPGTRVPTYIAAGILARNTHVFFMWVFLAVVVWTPFLLILTFVIGKPLLDFFREIFHGPWAILASFIVLFLVIKFISYEATWEGRHRLKADLGRLYRIEFWPAWLFYIPLLPWLAWLCIRYGPMSFTCVNPGIPEGGGIAGESKSRILKSLEGAQSDILNAIMLDAEGTPDERAGTLTKRIASEERDPGFDGYPVILKPDEGERGRGVDLVRSEQEARDYLKWVTLPVQAQVYHPGPCEAGIFWMRRLDPTGEDDASLDDRAGHIFSVTRKVFPEITGDGRHSIAQLIWMHPRYRMQAKTFLKRFEDTSDRVLDDGECFPLGVAGNHVQGAMFVDGQDLITPELEARIDGIAQRFRDPQNGTRFDFGRFDVRYTSDEELREGRGFAIIELNGTTSESTNLYDPGRSAFWSYGVLFRQWHALYRLGRQRRNEGARPLSLWALLKLIRQHREVTLAPRVSD